MRLIATTMLLTPAEHAGFTRGGRQPAARPMRNTLRRKGAHGHDRHASGMEPWTRKREGGIRMMRRKVRVKCDGSS